MAETKQTSVTAEATASGVEELIGRLREQGVDAGRAQANDIISKAQGKANDIVSQARQQAEEIVKEAGEKAEQLRTGGEDALRIATRDTVLRFREELMQYLNERVQRLVSEQLEDKEFLAKLILEVTSQASRDSGLEEAQKVEVLLPTQVLGIEELRANPEELEGKLSQLVKQIASATWREGVTFKPLQSEAGGIRVVLTENDLEIDLSDHAIADMVLQHLQPRFRALMQGIIR